MVQIVLQDKSIRNLERILEVLVRKKLVVNPCVDESQKYKLVEHGNFLKYKTFRLTAISRSILRKDIISLIEKTNQSNSLEFYTVPVVDMDWDQSSKVKGYFDEVKMIS